MQNLSRIKSLLEFLRAGQPSLDEIMKFVALDTLYDFSATAVFLNVVRLDGSIHVPAGYGYNPETIALAPERFISVDTPANRFLRTATIGECGGIDSFLFSGPDYSNILFPRGFEYSISWPIPGVGSVMTFCSKPHDLTVEREEFLLIIGSILAIEMLQVRSSQGLGKTTTRTGSGPHYSLTPRQWKVLAGIRRGQINADISVDLGFSESLIRQETIQIYRKLGVTGRKEILESDFDYSSEGAAS